MITVYVLTSENGRIYIGQTNDINRRLTEHNRGQTSSTKRGGGVWRIVHSENCENRTIATQREKALKSSRGRSWIREVVLRPSVDGR